MFHLMRTMVCKYSTSLFLYCLFVNIVNITVLYYKYKNKFLFGSGKKCDRISQFLICHLGPLLKIPLLWLIRLGTI